MPNTTMALKFQEAKWCQTRGSKQSKYCFDQQLKNHLADSKFQKGADNFEIEHKTAIFLIRGIVPL